MLAARSDAAIIVDVLSFSTCVDIATARGAIILPYPWRDASADTYARQNNALLASKTRCLDGAYSLVPTSLLTLPSGTRLVLPSPNGSTLRIQAATSAVTLSGCLRNAQAGGGSCEDARAHHCGDCMRRAMGDGSLRSAFEDVLGAGAIIKWLAGEPSPEALAAMAVFEQCHADLPNILKRCASGRKLIERGFEADVVLSGQLDVSQSVPLLQEGCYIDGSGASSHLARSPGAKTAGMPALLIDAAGLTSVPAHEVIGSVLDVKTQLSTA